MDTRRTHAYIMLDVTRDLGVRILSHRAALVQRRAKSNMLPAGSRPIGKQTWQALKRYASGRFLLSGFEAILTAGSRHGNHRFP